MIFSGVKREILIIKRNNNHGVISATLNEQRKYIYQDQKGASSAIKKIKFLYIQDFMTHLSLCGVVSHFSLAAKDVLIALLTID